MTDHTATLAALDKTEAAASPRPWAEELGDVYLPEHPEGGIILKGVRWNPIQRRQANAAIAALPGPALLRALCQMLDEEGGNWEEWTEKDDEVFADTGIGMARAALAESAAVLGVSDG